MHVLAFSVDDYHLLAITPSYLTYSRMDTMPLIIPIHAQYTAYILRDGPCRYRIRKGFVPNMKVEGTFYVNSHLGLLSR